MSDLRTMSDEGRWPDLRGLILRDVVGAKHRANALADLDALILASAQRDRLLAAAEMASDYFRDSCNGCSDQSQCTCTETTMAALRSVVNEIKEATK